jgi:hypothetical protein
MQVGMKTSKAIQSGEQERDSVTQSPLTSGRKDIGRHLCVCVRRSIVKGYLPGGRSLDFMYGMALYGSGSSVPHALKLILSSRR